MENSYVWCSKGLEPDYVDCSKCIFYHPDKTCQYRSLFHWDAVKDCDKKRGERGLPLIFKDPELMGKNYKKKELIKRGGQRGQASFLSQSPPSPKPIKSDATQLILGGMAACIALGFPMAYIGQLFQLFSMYIFDMFEIFVSSEPHPEVWSKTFEGSFFYAGFFSRYLYWTSLMIAVWGWINYDPRYRAGEFEQCFRVCSTVLFVIVAFINFNLLIGTIVGPLFLILGLLITAKR